MTAGSFLVVGHTAAETVVGVIGLVLIGALLVWALRGRRLPDLRDVPDDLRRADEGEPPIP